MVFDSQLRGSGSDPPPATSSEISQVFLSESCFQDSCSSLVSQFSTSQRSVPPPRSASGCEPGNTEPGFMSTGLLASPVDCSSCPRGEVAEGQRAVNHRWRGEVAGGALRSTPTGQEVGGVIIRRGARRSLSENQNKTVAGGLGTLGRRAAGS